MASKVLSAGFLLFTSPLSSVPVHLSPALAPVASSLFLLRPLGMFSLPGDSFSPFHLAYPWPLYLGLNISCLQGFPCIPYARLGHAITFHSSCTFLSEHSFWLYNCLVLYWTESSTKTQILFSCFPALFTPRSRYLIHSRILSKYSSDKWIQSLRVKWKIQCQLIYVLYSLCLSLHLISQLQWLVIGVDDSNISSLKMSYHTKLKILRLALFTSHSHTEVALLITFLT